jgi:hypothetical protein
VLATLPFELRSKILRHLYAGVIARVPLLQAMAHDDMFMSDVCVRLQAYSCTRESFVFQRGEEQESSQTFDTPPLTAACRQSYKQCKARHTFT